MSAKVLLMDDPQIGKLSNIILRPMSIRLVQDQPGHEGLKNAYTDQPDLTILALRVPEMDGVENRLETAQCRTAV